MNLDDVYAKEQEKNEEEEEKQSGNEQPRQVSIYDIEDEYYTPDKPNETQPKETYAYTFSTVDKKLSFIGNDAEYLPTEIIYQFGLKTLILDISFNMISDLRELEQFPYLEELICDNNEISEATNFPHLKSLKIFSCNKNKINDIHVFVDKIKVQFPHLTYLSLLGNMACPNQLIDMSKDDYDYSQYRKYVLYRLKNLKFLDCYEVTKDERQKVENQSVFLNVVTPNGQSAANLNGRKNQPENGSPAKNPFTPLTKLKSNDADLDKQQGSFGYCRYVYRGKQSEGNRFIKNEDL